jgi:hypothetical protein
MSIWNIVEYKPRAPQAQGNLQSAYTVESDRVKPDLAAGFRVQNSDQNQYPNNSFLFLENAARLPQIDPFAWGDTYENILQVKEDYNRGFIPTLDCLSVRQQSQVSADGVPTNPPPPSQPIVPNAIAQNNSTFGNSHKNAQNDANHEKKLAFTKREMIKYEPPKVQEIVNPEDVKPEDVKREEVKPEDLLNFDEKVASNERKKSIISSFFDWLSPGRVERKEEYEEKEPVMYSQYDLLRINRNEIEAYLDNRLKKLVEELKPDVVQESKTQNEYVDRIETLSSKLNDAKVVLVELTDQVKKFQDEFALRNLGGMMRRGSILDAVVEIRDDLSKLTDVQNQLKEQLEQKENALVRSNPNEAVQVAKEIKELKDILANKSMNESAILQQLIDRIKDVEQSGANSIVKLNEVANKSLQLMNEMKVDFQNESKSIQQTMSQLLWSEFTGMQANLMDKTRNELKSLQQEIVAFKANVSVENQQLFEHTRNQLAITLQQFGNVIEASQRNVVASIYEMQKEMFLMSQEQREAIFVEILRTQMINEQQRVFLSLQLNYVQGLIESATRLGVRPDENVVRMIEFVGNIPDEELSQQVLQIEYPMDLSEEGGMPVVEQQTQILDFGASDVSMTNNDMSNRGIRKRRSEPFNYPTAFFGPHQSNFLVIPSQDQDVNEQKVIESKESPRSDMSIDDIRALFYNKLFPALKGTMRTEEEANKTTNMYADRFIAKLQKTYGRQSSYKFSISQLNRMIDNSQKGIVSPRKTRSGKTIR